MPADHRGLLFSLISVQFIRRLTFPRDFTSLGLVGNIQARFETIPTVWDDIPDPNGPSGSGLVLPKPHVKSSRTSMVCFASLLPSNLTGRTKIQSSCPCYQVSLYSAPFCTVPPRPFPVPSPPGSVHQFLMSPPFSFCCLVDISFSRSYSLFRRQRHHHSRQTPMKLMTPVTPQRLGHPLRNRQQLDIKTSTPSYAQYFGTSVSSGSYSLASN